MSFQIVVAVIKKTSMYTANVFILKDIIKILNAFNSTWQIIHKKYYGRSSNNISVKPLSMEKM